MKKLRLLKKTQAHACPICMRLEHDRKQMKQLRAALTLARSSAERTTLEEKIDELKDLLLQQRVQSA